MNKKLYRLTNELGDWFVIAEHPTAAEERLMEHLNAANYGISDKRAVRVIELVSTEAADTRFLTGHFLLT